MAVLYTLVEEPSLHSKGVTGEIVTAKIYAGVPGLTLQETTKVYRSGYGACNCHLGLLLGHLKSVNLSNSAATQDQK